MKTTFPVHALQKSYSHAASLHCGNVNLGAAEVYT
jgi:hypothetical protein